MGDGGSREKWEGWGSSDKELWLWWEEWDVEVGRQGWDSETPRTVVLSAGPARVSHWEYSHLLQLALSPWELSFRSQLSPQRTRQGAQTGVWGRWDGDQSLHLHSHRSCPPLSLILCKKR